MARGFESKSVEAQQEEAARRTVAGPTRSPAEQARAERTRTLLLARARAAADLENATIPAHRHMLEQAITALDDQLRDLAV